MALNSQMYVAFNPVPVPHRQTIIDTSSTNLIIILFMMQVSKKIPFEDPSVLNIVRGLYTISNLVIVGVYIYMQSKINAKKGFAPITHTHISLYDTDELWPCQT